MTSHKRDKVAIKNEITSEKTELDNKIEKLKRFTLSIDFISLGQPQKVAMFTQLDAMEVYSIALRSRIIDITKQEAE